MEVFQQLSAIYTKTWDSAQSQLCLMINDQTIQ